MCGRLSFCGEVGRQNHLSNRAQLNALFEFEQSDILGANAIERAEFPHEHKIKTFVGPGTLNGGLIGRRFDHTQLPTISRRIRASFTHLQLSKGMALTAMPHISYGLSQGPCKHGRRLPVVLQQVIGHTRGGLAPYTRQTLEGFNQGLKSVCLRHCVFPVS